MVAGPSTRKPSTGSTDKSSTGKSSVDGTVDPGLFGPESVTWRVHADPTMLLAGVRALLLQALHPLAMAGVAEHSSFRQDPWGRLVRTAEYLGAVTYGTTEEAQAALDRVRAVHVVVRGTDPHTGLGYRADDPELLRWVHCCEVDSFLGVTRRAGLRISAADADRYLTEQQLLPRLLGVPESLPVPGTVSELAGYFDEVRPALQLTPAARDAARFALMPPLPGWVALLTPARPTWAAVTCTAAGLLPPWARRMYGLPVPPGAELAATVAARSWRTGLVLLPGVLREGPYLKAARARFGADAP
ncbi:oxygenase MpaB family protein [Streptacidiphilus sp. EB129]|uniref:oxygenase MpaB family protein n=1 Tax=Streptacidiphilus sp. EB129 TaxID=3156262 RepID=UPI00351846AA